MATTNVAGANRAANARPNMPDCIASSLTSTAGPTTKNTSRGHQGNHRQARSNERVGLRAHRQHHRQRRHHNDTENQVRAHMLENPRRHHNV